MAGDMGVTRILQIGMGPLGKKMVVFASARKGMKVVAAVDKDPALKGKKLSELCGVAGLNVTVTDSLVEAITKGKPDVVVLTTVSDMARLSAQLDEILQFRLPVVSTCEELTYPWEASVKFAKKVDAAARKARVAVLGTGVNPGYLMDTLPIALTAVCQSVDSVKVSRIQDARFRRVPFQKKIGAGLSLAEFEARKKDGSLKHVGLTQSMQMIASRMGWKLDKTEDIITPIIATSKIVTDAMTIPKGHAAGVQQIGRGWEGKKERITLMFRAAINEPKPADTVEISGDPNIKSTIPGGVNGDVATCAITLNAVQTVIKAEPGLRTMADVPLVSFSL